MKRSYYEEIQEKGPRWMHFNNASTLQARTCMDGQGMLGIYCRQGIYCLKLGWWKENDMVEKDYIRHTLHTLTW